MTPFEYHRAASLDEAIERLAADPEGTRLLAGGTDLIVFMTDGKLAPRTLLDPKPIAELRGIAVNGGVSIGGGTTMRAIEQDATILRDYRGLATGAGEVGSVQIRNRATLGGNLGTSSPAADTPPALLAHGAMVEIAGPAGRRSIALGEFFTGPGRNILAPGELVVAVHLPPVGRRSGSVYVKLAARRAMDIAFVGVAGYVSLADDGTVESIGLGLGAVAPTPVAVDLSMLVGGRLDDEALAAAAEAATAACSPISDQRASAEYRRAMVGVLTKRTLRGAAAQAEARP